MIAFSVIAVHCMKTEWAQLAAFSFIRRFIFPSVADYSLEPFTISLATATTALAAAIVSHNSCCSSCACGGRIEIRRAWNVHQDTAAGTPQMAPWLSFPLNPIDSPRSSASPLSPVGHDASERVSTYLPLLLWQVQFNTTSLGLSLCLSDYDLVGIHFLIR